MVVRALVLGATRQAEATGLAPIPGLDTLILGRYTTRCVSEPLAE